jgi:hypothetical protein
VPFAAEPKPLQRRKGVRGEEEERGMEENLPDSAVKQIVVRFCRRQVSKE